MKENFRGNMFNKSHQLNPLSVALLQKANLEFQTAISQPSFKIETKHKILRNINCVENLVYETSCKYNFHRDDIEIVLTHEKISRVLFPKKILHERVLNIFTIISIVFLIYKE